MDYRFRAAMVACLIALPVGGGARAQDAAPPAGPPDVAAPEAPASAIPVEVERVTLVTSWRGVSSFSGIVRANRRSELGFERPGRVEKIFCNRGDKVAANQLLGSLNTDQIEASIRKLEADRRAAESTLEELRAGPRLEAVDAARAAVRQQDAQLAIARSNLARRQSLVAGGAVSREDYESAQAEVTRIEASRAAAQKQLEELQLGTREERIASQEAVIASYDAAIDVLRVERDHSRIYSPFAGSIVDRRVDEGSVVGPERTALVINEDAILEAHIGVPAEVAVRITPGTRLDVRARGVAVSATAKSVVRQVDEQTRTVTLIASLAPGSDILPGELVRLELRREQQVEGFWISTSAMLQGPRGLWECFVVVPEGEGTRGVLSRRTLEVLQTEGERALVRGALRDGDVVVRSAVHRLIAGQAVQPVEGDPL